MPMLRLALRMLPIAPMVLAVGAVSGQDYPAKPIRIITSAPGGSSDFMFVVHPSLPVKSVKELIALAKARPGELNYGSGGIGGASHLPAELFKSMAGANIVNVNYKGTGQAINALVAGEIQLMFANATISSPQIKAGRLRGVAVGSLQRSALLPDLPTVAASGLPGFESVVLQGILTRANTPAAHISRLNQEIVRVLNRADVKERLFSTGVEIVGSSPEELAATIRADIVKWDKVIKDAGIRVE